MDFKELIQIRQSVRRYQEKPVEHEKIETSSAAFAISKCRKLGVQMCTQSISYF